MHVLELLWISLMLHTTSQSTQECALIKLFARYNFLACDKAWMRHDAFREYTLEQKATVITLSHDGMCIKDNFVFDLFFSPTSFVCFNPSSSCQFAHIDMWQDRALSFCSIYLGCSQLPWTSFSRHATVRTHRSTDCQEVKRLFGNNFALRTLPVSWNSILRYISTVPSYICIKEQWNSISRYINIISLDSFS